MSVATASTCDMPSATVLIFVSFAATFLISEIFLAAVSTFSMLLPTEFTLAISSATVLISVSFAATFLIFSIFATAALMSDIFIETSYTALVISSGVTSAKVSTFRHLSKTSSCS